MANQWKMNLGWAAIPDIFFTAWGAASLAAFVSQAQWLDAPEFIELIGRISSAPFEPIVSFLTSVFRWEIDPFLLLFMPVMIFGLLNIFWRSMRDYPGIFLKRTLAFRIVHTLMGLCFALWVSGQLFDFADLDTVFNDWRRGEYVGENLHIQFAMMFGLYIFIPSGLFRLGQLIGLAYACYYLSSNYAFSAVTLCSVMVGLAIASHYLFELMNFVFRFSPGGLIHRMLPGGS
ncbi:hypothetical protein [Parvularcula marina]|uniref:Uncharacterized protein n=1 Tax=Parvularcula marina TaxID=2292771 RepID=A0A371RG14_9PROT|nr:hypothetical protein [Parvularcula marina]RFB04382.1 hypothetical protein DX908_03230 [Parvularcula marina]